jgi:hypothetical protein
MNPPAQAPSATANLPPRPSAPPTPALTSAVPISTTSAASAFCPFWRLGTCTLGNQCRLIHDVRGTWHLVFLSFECRVSSEEYDCLILICAEVAAARPPSVVLPSTPTLTPLSSAPSTPVIVAPGGPSSAGYPQPQPKPAPSLYPLPSAAPSLPPAPASSSSGLSSVAALLTSHTSSDELDSDKPAICFAFATTGHCVYATACRNLHSLPSTSAAATTATAPASAKPPPLTAVGSGNSTNSSRSSLGMLSPSSASKSQQMPLFSSASSDALPDLQPRKARASPHQHSSTELWHCLLGLCCADLANQFSVDMTAAPSASPGACLQDDAAQ